ncbi:hypothetical protein GCM10009779_43130 [Polymorphospora rubra]|uniref:Uncharacterized protein n=1 Tax=Polymorphospora rubra TaxID=338584 RepID=A0A810N9E7_9ACTN|nr:hypothetical protein Prubr_52240 [Polymorphospora rubra]
MAEKQGAVRQYVMGNTFADPTAVRQAVFRRYGRRGAAGADPGVGAVGELAGNSVAHTGADGVGWQPPRPGWPAQGRELA